MATKPTKLPEWASSGSGQTPDITEPTSTKKGKGWIVEKPAHDVFNWILNIIYLWCAYLDDLTNQALTWTAAHVFSVAPTFTLGAAFGVDPTFPARAITNLGTGTGASLGTNWSLYVASNERSAGSYIQPGGRVELAGGLKTTSSGPSSTAFTLPASLRPTTDKWFTLTYENFGGEQARAILHIVASTGAGLIGFIGDAGGVTIPNNAVFHLDGIAWDKII